MSNHIFDNRLKKLEDTLGSSHRFIPVFIDERKNEIRIPEMKFTGTSEDFEQLKMTQSNLTYIVMKIPRPWF